MKGQFASLIVFSTVFAMVATYPTTVPPTPAVCAKMTPGHGPSPQKSQAPYQIEVSTNSVKGGNNVQVKLSGIGGAEFKGFYVQARDSTGSPIGVFIKADGVKTHGCGGIKNNGAHHAGKDLKESITVVWQAPKDYSGDVTFTATFVQEFEVFWTQIKSSPVTISKDFDFPLTTPRRTLITDSSEEGETTEATQESRVLNYNPYSPTVLRDEDFVSKDFSLSNPDDASFSTTQLPSSSTRIRKSYYIPKSSQSYTIHDSNHQDCISKPHYDGNFNDPPEQNLPSYYNPNAFKQVLSTKYQTHGSHGAGYLNLEGPSQKPILPHQDQIRYFDQPVFNKKNPYNGFRPSFSSEYNLNQPTIKQQYSYGNVIGTNDFRITAGQKPDTPIYGNYPVNSGQHGILVGDYVPISNPGIVIPKGMQSYQIPRYGYLVFNPKRGPPFYLIPVGVEDNASFEEAHHLGDRFETLPQPAFGRFRSRTSSSGTISFESGKSASRYAKL